MQQEKQIQGVLEGLRNHKMLTTLTRQLPKKPPRPLLRSPNRNTPLKTPSTDNQIKLFNRPKLDKLSSLLLNEASMGDSVVVSIPKRRDSIFPGRYQSILKAEQKSQVLSGEPLLLQLQMKRIAPNYKDETLANLLKQVSGQENVSTLRIYRETFRQIYTARYGRDVLTGFFNFQYIEDYDSLGGYLKSIVQMSHQQIILLCFLTLDHDGDGVISNKDVFSTLVDCDNPLINADLYELVKYIHSYKQQQQSLHDPASALCNSKMTLTKFRLICKKKEQRENDLFKKSVPTRSLSKGPMRLRTSLSLPPPGMAQDRVTKRNIPSRMFTFQPIDQNEMNDKEERRLMTKQFLSYLIQCQYEFGINLERLGSIFKFKVPETFYDILFVLGGLKIQGKNYQPLYIPSNDIKAGYRSIVQPLDYTRQLKLFRESCNSLATVRLQRHLNTPTN